MCCAPAGIIMHEELRHRNAAARDLFCIPHHTESAVFVPELSPSS